LDLLSTLLKPYHCNKTQGLHYYSIYRGDHGSLK